METVPQTATTAHVSSPKPKRPLIITILCVLAALGLLITIPLIFSPLASSVGSWYPPYLAFSAVVGAICFIGFWKMKKWAVYLYTAFMLVNQVVLLVENKWNISALILPLIIVIIGFSQLQKMD